MGWMTQISHCEHKYQDLMLCGFKMQLCSECGSVMGWSEADQRWLWCGSMHDAVQHMKHNQISARVKCSREEMIRADSLRA
jgi:hypothetical protein